MTKHIYTHIGTLKQMVTGSGTERVDLRETERSWITTKGVAYNKETGLHALRTNKRLLINSIKKRR